MTACSSPNCSRPAQWVLCLTVPEVGWEVRNEISARLFIPTAVTLCSKHKCADAKALFKDKSISRLNNFRLAHKLAPLDFAAALTSFEPLGAKIGARPAAEVRSMR